MSAQKRYKREYLRNAIESVAYVFYAAKLDSLEEDQAEAMLNLLWSLYDKEAD